MVATTDNEFVIEQIKTITHTTPRLVEDYSLLDITPSERLQVRIDRNNAPKHMIERYRWQMGSGAVFPPPVVTEDKKTIDGNTRIKARLARQEAHTPVLVVPLSWDGSDDQTKHRLLLLGAVLNNVNGLPLDEKERERMIKHAINLGMTDQQIQYSVGITGLVVKALRAKLQAEARLESVGIDPIHVDEDEERDYGLSAAVIRALGGDDITRLDDASYRGLATLAKDALFKANEVKSLAASLRGLDSQPIRDERVAREREAQAQRIAEVSHGETGRPPLAQQARRNLGMFLKHPAELFVERQDEDMVEHLRVLREAADVIERVIELQGDVMPAATAEAAE